ncbi:MAG: hypothetical protein HKN70_15085 [Gammaproteobacteria bacterium]|nr:hypothetical protein [Gammaproteobacteria bacterium]
MQCVASVRDWSDTQGYDYLWLDDELFAVVPANIREKTVQQPVVATDLARLLHLQRALKKGYDSVVWCDADTLVIDPQQLLLSASPFAVGREVWVQMETESPPARPRAFVKVHNAFMQFDRSNVFLDFYCDAALRMLERHPAPFVSQLIGPKLLTALHNIVALPVMETAAVLSPAVALDMLNAGGPCLDLFCHKSRQIPAALNLCASSVTRGELTDFQMHEVCETVHRQHGSIFGRCAVDPA